GRAVLRTLSLHDALPISRHEERLAARAQWEPPDPSIYCYALGLYLGDGHIVRRSSHSGWLRLTLDAVYPALIDEGQPQPTGMARSEEHTSELQSRRDLVC